MSDKHTITPMPVQLAGPDPALAHLPVAPYDTIDQLRADNEVLRKRLANALDHLETVLSSDSDMPSHESTWADAEAFLDTERAR